MRWQDIVLATTFKSLHTPCMNYYPERIALAALINKLASAGDCPATSSNFSFRTEHGAMVTASGIDKESLSAKDFVHLNLEGVVHGHGRPSAETALHLELYKSYPKCGAILHTHPLIASLIKEDVEIEGEELLKALPGYSTHESKLVIPVVENSQDMKDITDAIHPRLNEMSCCYIIRRHGIYVWGKDLGEAKRHYEAISRLLQIKWSKSWQH